MSARRSDNLAWIVNALRAAKAEAKVNGIPVPAEVDELLDDLIMFGFDASRRQATTPLEDEPATPEVVAVRYSTAARLLELSVRQVQRLVADGRLVPIHLGGSRRIPVAQLKNLTQENQ